MKRTVVILTIAILSAGCSAFLDEQPQADLTRAETEQEALGSKYADEYQCTLLGEVANSKFVHGQLVAVSLRFSTHENNGVYYQDIMANEIVRVI